MDEFNGCICQLLGSLIGGVWSAMAESDAFSVSTDLGGLSSQGGMQAATVAQPRLTAGAAGAGGDGASDGALAEASASGSVTPAQIAALIILVIVVLLTFLQGSTGATPAASKRRRGGGGGGDNGRDEESPRRRQGPSVA